MGNLTDCSLEVLHISDLTHAGYHGQHPAVAVGDDPPAAHLQGAVQADHALGLDVEGQPLVALNLALAGGLMNVHTIIMVKGKT